MEQGYHQLMEEPLPTCVLAACGTKNHRKLVVCGCIMFLVLFIGFLWTRALLDDRKSYEKVSLDPDDLFQHYGNPNGDASSIWECKQFAGNTRCWNDDESYLLIGAKWTQIRGSSNNGE